MNAPENIAAAITHDYDEMPYVSNAFFYCAPGNLRAAAYLFGVESVPLERARVLELGCAAGGNILPFAAAYPEAHVVGVDLSSVQIDAGLALVEAAGLKNLHLHAMSLTDIDASFGKFDYIIAHGVFSWIPPEVRAALLRVCSENLSENGLAFVSYNTYPGWKLKEVMRDAMLMASHGAESATEAVARARAVQEMFNTGSAPGSLNYAPMRQLAGAMSLYSDHYVAHEFLERYNNPCYFVEFAAAASEAGLAYVGDALPQTDMAITYGMQVRLTNNLVSLGQPRVSRLQFLDMATGQSFRRSVLTHAAQANQAGDVDLERLAGLHFAVNLPRVTGDMPDLKANEVRYARGANDIVSIQDNPVMVQLLRAFQDAWPRTVAFDTLLADSNVSNQAPDVHRAAVLEALRQLLGMELLRMRREPVGFGAESQSRPALLPGALPLLLADADAPVAVALYNYWHQTANLQADAATRFLLPLLDGTRTTVQLRTALRDALNAGTITVNGASLAGKRNLDGVAMNLVNTVLAALQNVALLG